MDVVICIFFLNCFQKLFRLCINTEKEHYTLFIGLEVTKALALMKYVKLNKNHV